MFHVGLKVPVRIFKEFFVNINFIEKFGEYYNGVDKNLSRNREYYHCRVSFMDIPSKELYREICQFILENLGGFYPEFIVSIPYNYKSTNTKFKYDCKEDVLTVK